MEPSKPTDRPCILTTLEKLNDDEFMEFKRFLCDPVRLEGNEPFKEAELRDKAKVDMADIILRHFPRDNVDQIMANVLGKVGKKDLRKQYQSKGRVNAMLTFWNERLVFFSSDYLFFRKHTGLHVEHEGEGRGQLEGGRGGDEKGRERGVNI